MDDRKSLLIAFLAISDQYKTLILLKKFTQWLLAAILEDRKSLVISFLLFQINTQIFFFSHFGWPKITFNRISRYLTFFSQNGFWRPFWKTENHFWSHFSPLQINTQLFFFWIFFYKMAAGGHFGWPKITFDCISRHFRSIQNFNFIKKIHTMAAGGHFGRPKITCNLILAISDQYPNLFIFLTLDDRKSLLIAFLGTSDQYLTFFFTKWLLAAILEDWKSLLIAFLTIADQYATFLFFWFFFTKWPLAAILDDRKSLLIAFLAISDQYPTLIFFTKWPLAAMASGGHFGWLKITFNRISRHFRSIRNFSFFWIFFTKWPLAAILDDRKSLLITFVTISDQYTTLISLDFFSQNGIWRPFWMTENHFRSHFSPFQINTQLLFYFFFFIKWPPVVILDDQKSLLITSLAISDQ